MCIKIRFGCGVKALSSKRAKTLRVEEDTWLQLMTLKYKLRKRDIDELLKYLLECYQREAVSK